MEYFKDGYGLVTTNDPTTENCNLFYAEYLTLKYEPDQDHVAQKDYDFFMNNMLLKWDHTTGLYNRRFPETPNEKGEIRTVSQDEILGWLVSSRILGTYHGENIWLSILADYGRYNNTGRQFLPYNLANYYSWGQIVRQSKFKWTDIFILVYIVNLLLACYKDPKYTSSKIMYWLEFSHMPKSWINIKMGKFFQKRMIKQYGHKWLEVMICDIYFKNEPSDFPLKKMLRKTEP